jgi:RNA polymerase sigma-70 factor (ECF subfamily)
MAVDRTSDEDVSGVFREGHPDALALVYERFGALVYSIALRSLRASSDAEDVTQQVFVSAWRSRGSFDPERGTLGGWLVTRSPTRCGSGSGRAGCCCRWRGRVGTSA